MKKFITFIMTLIIIAISFQKPVYAEQNKPPAVSADGAILMDAETGEILYSKNIDKPYPPASTTKLMTALLTFENCNLDDKVTVGKIPPQVDGSKIYLYEGEVLTVRQLLYGLILPSANDCAEALAEHIGGSIPKFAEMMNEKANQIGCKNSNFVNPSGLYNAKHRTTARDLALIMKELIKYPEYTTIATTNSYNIPATNKCEKIKPLWNENRLVQKGSKYYYEGCIGGKTGYTDQSKHSYVACAERNNQKLIVAFIHDSKKTFFSDAVKLLNYGFDNFTLEKLYSKYDIVKNIKIDDEINIPLLAKDNIYYVKNIKDTETPTINITEDTSLALKTFSKGDVILKGTIRLKNKDINSIEFISGCDYSPKQNIVKTTTKQIKNSYKYILFFIFVIIIFSFLCFFKIMKNKHKKRLELFRKIDEKYRKNNGN